VVRQSLFFLKEIDQSRCLQNSLKNLCGVFVLYISVAKVMLKHFEIFIR